MASARKTQDQQGKAQLRLDPVLDVSRARRLHAQLSEAMEQAIPIELDVGQVVRVDTAALQILTVFQRAAHDRGIRLHWSGESRALQEADRLLGLNLFEGKA